MISVDFPTDSRDAQGRGGQVEADVLDGDDVPRSRRSGR